MLEWLLETAISYGIEWLIDTVVDEAGNIIYNLITDNDGLTDALVEYLPKFLWKENDDGEVYNELGENISDVIERFRTYYINKNDGDDTNDLPIESNGIIDTDIEKLQLQTVQTQASSLEQQTDTAYSSSVMCTIALFCGLFSLFTTVLNYTKNFIYKKCYKGKEKN